MATWSAGHASSCHRLVCADAQHQSTPQLQKQAAEWPAASAAEEVRSGGVAWLFGSGCETSRGPAEPWKPWTPLQHGGDEAVWSQAKPARAWGFRGCGSCCDAAGGPSEALQLWV